MTSEYVSPLVERFATKEMARLWSAQTKFSTWRKCWVALAEAEKELGLPVTDEQIEEMRAHVDDVGRQAGGRRIHRAPPEHKPICSQRQVVGCARGDR